MTMKRPRIPFLLLLVFTSILSVSSAERLSEKDFGLGGPCVDVSRYPPGFHKQQMEATEAGDWERVIELQKQSVRAMCSNNYRWLELAEAYAAAGRTDVSIEILTELHEKGEEIKASTLKFQERLKRLIEMPEFRRSALGREVNALRIEAERRRNESRVRLAALGPEVRPSDNYVAKGACPFECCRFREWEVLETTPLYDAPFGSTVVGSVTHGIQVQGVTGQVHLRPVPVAIVHDHPPFVQGEIIFVLDYLGEGYFNYWRDGEIAVDDLWINEQCLRPSADCWAEYLQPSESRTEPQWWVLIETHDGVRGWTNQTERFGNKDACG